MIPFEHVIFNPFLAGLYFFSDRLLEKAADCLSILFLFFLTYALHLQSARHDSKCFMHITLLILTTHYKVGTPINPIFRGNMKHREVIIQLLPTRPQDGIRHAKDLFREMSVKSKRGESKSR